MPSAIYGNLQGQRVGVPLVVSHLGQRDHWAGRDNVAADPFGVGIVEPINPVVHAAAGPQLVGVVAAVRAVDVIQKLEQGRKANARITTLTAIAEALDVDLASLLSKPTHLETIPPDGGLLALRRALTPVLDDAGELGDPDEFRAQLVEAWAAYWSGDYDLLSGFVPGVIAGSRGLADEMEPRRKAAPAEESLWGNLLITAATAAARAGDEDGEANDLPSVPTGRRPGWVGRGTIIRRRSALSRW